MDLGSRSFVGTQNVIDFDFGMQTLPLAEEEHGVTNDSASCAGVLLMFGAENPQRNRFCKRDDRVRFPQNTETFIVGEKSPR
ncbi:hypothetical protein Y032_0121g963 [Ancylostoma ceylanicum]|uniref:Uncharacterized protein n=1 Tax=Ancylostoma ceylanicum TaxID=53326 RepID=A0A016T9K0_9BILA|nr:hypothetical protein Y032_0121g963 [Ancylostoma ceylanicum]